MPFAADPGWYQSYWYGPSADQHRRHVLGGLAAVVLSLAGRVMFRLATGRRAS